MPVSRSLPAFGGEFALALNVARLFAEPTPKLSDMDHDLKTDG